MSSVSVLFPSALTAIQCYHSVAGSVFRSPAIGEIHIHHIAQGLPPETVDYDNLDKMHFQYFSSSPSGSHNHGNSVYISSDDSGKDMTRGTKSAGLLVVTLASKLIIKLLAFLLTKFPTLLTLLLPSITTLYFLAGVLFGRLTAGLINPPTTITTTPSTATTTTTPSSTTAGTVSFFFGTNLSGAGATVGGPIGVCENFPAQADNQVQSLQLGAGTTCIVVCDSAGCTGTCYRITGTTTVNDFGSFNNMISSFMFC